MKKLKDYGWLIVFLFLIMIFLFKPLSTTFGQPEEKKPRKITLVNMRVVDIERIINEYSGARTVAVEIQGFIAAEVAKCNQYKEEMKKYQRDLKKYEDSLSVEDQNKYLRAIEIRKQQYENCLKAKDQNILSKEASLKAPILAQIYSAIESISLKNGYNMIVDSRSAIFYTQDLDITNEILEELQ